MILKLFEISSTELSCYINEITNMLYGELSGEKESITRDKIWFEAIAP